MLWLGAFKDFYRLSLPRGRQRTRTNAGVWPKGVLRCSQRAKKIYAHTLLIIFCPFNHGVCTGTSFSQTNLPGTNFPGMNLLGAQKG